MLLWSSPCLAACTWAPALCRQPTWLPATETGSSAAWNSFCWTGSKKLLVDDPFHSKNIVWTIWPKGMASWLGQWGTEDLLMFSYLAQLREKANARACEGLETQRLQTFTCGHKSQPCRCLCQVSLAGCQHCPVECRWGMWNRWIIKYFKNY